MMERASRTGTAAVLREVGGALTRTEIVCDALRPDEVLVQMAGAGICHTDLSAMEGVVPVPLPVVLGHEGAGVVIERGSAVTALEPGDHVVLSFDACRACPACQRGLPGYCTHARALNYACARSDGTTTLRDAVGPVHGGWFGQSSLSSIAVASQRNAVRVPRSSDLALLAPLGCGIQTGAGTVLRALKPSPGQGIAIFGAGAVGAGSLMAAVAARCAPIVVVDPLPSRRQLALELGATHTLAPEEVGERSSGLRKVLGGLLDFCIDTVGTQAVITQALNALGAPGVCATLALRGGANPISISQTHLLYGRTLVGVIEGDADPHAFIPELVRMWRAGQLPLERVIQTFPFERLDEALAKMRDGSVVKPVLTFGVIE
ncbi:NAD(P)-dependent alcohol dehydrogenase [Hyalangium versicolor]|uniref:NAD(P)-dependent alcohol dehydrogenase n=1 Tax=Hyalangium versicolor TaxID=2861190 RepID=UPI001CCEBD68|nr:NAD(P)-dependent alcohol dehydrogenase [Hyalangium versicolor]